LRQCLSLLPITARKTSKHLTLFSAGMKRHGNSGSRQDRQTQQALSFPSLAAAKQQLPALPR